MNNTKKPPLTDEAISQLLRELPRHKASVNFAARTLRAAKQKPRKNRIRFFTFAVAAASVFVAMFWLTSTNQSPAVHAPMVVDTSTTRSLQPELAELERMSQEIRRLQAISDSKKAMIRVRGESQQEYYIDMSRVANATAEKTYAHFRPTRKF